MRKLVFTVGALLCTAGCSSAEPSSSQGASSAPASGYEADRVTAFLASRYEPEDVRHSFQSTLGDTIDCIDFFAQPGVKALAARGRPVTSIPTVPDMPASFRPSTTNDASGGPRAAFDGSLDASGSVRSCPSGTVPQVRITPEQIAHAGGLDAFTKAVHTKVAPKIAQKVGPDEYGSCLGDYDGYSHVYGQLLTSATVAAGSSVLSLNRPSIPAIPSPVDIYSPQYGDHSISQTWMVGFTNDASCPGCTQTIEVGWNVDASLYEGDVNTPHLFIFSTADGYATTGCYNDWPAGSQEYPNDTGNDGVLTCIPWVQVSGQYVPGMKLPSSAVQAVNPRNPSTLPKELALTTVKLGGSWWIFMQVSGGLPEPLGFYAGSAIDASMSIYEMGGEVYDGTNTFAGSGVEMGSGQPPAEGQGYAAYHRDYVALQETAGSDAGTPVVDDAFVCAARPQFYNYSATPKPVSQAAGPWVNYFYYGGNPPASAGATQ